MFRIFRTQLDNAHSGLYFLDHPGGCGKTFLIDTIFLFLASVRAQRKIAITTASSGLAATLLPGGRTVHSTFKVPINIWNTNVPKVKPGYTVCVCMCARACGVCVCV